MEELPRDRLVASGMAKATEPGRKIWLAIAVILAGILVCGPPSVCAAAERTAGVSRRIKLQGFQGYSGTHNWGHYAAPFTLVNLDKDPAPEVLVKEWRDWSYRGRGRYHHGNTQPARLYAYDHDGSPVWEYDQGRGVNVGVNFGPAIAYDMDGDGICEVFCRKADDPEGQWPGIVKSDGEHDWIVRLDPATGKELCKAPWPAQHGYPDNNQLLIGYLDGRTPYVIVCGGHYSSQMTIRAYSKNLGLHWQSKWKGHGSHTPSCADVDGDGMDEVILGSAVLDHDGKLLWELDIGHVDLAVAADIDWKSPGLEILFGSQDAHFTGLARGRDGTVLWSKKLKSHGQEGCGEFDAAIDGLECFGWQDKKDGYAESGINMWDAMGNELSASDYFSRKPGGKDATLYLWWRGARTMDALGAQGLPNPGFMRMVGDIQGDWREEVAWIDRDEVIICSAPGRPLVPRSSLREDRKYRAELAWGSFYFAQTHFTRPMPAGNPSRGHGQKRGRLLGQRSGPPKRPKRKRPRPGAVDEWDARLLARIREELAAGRRVRFSVAAFQKRFHVTAVSDAGALAVRGGGMQMDMDWARLAPADRKSLALAVLREGNEADHALAAFYLLAVRDEEEASKHLQEAGDRRAEVEAAFEQDM